MQDYSISPREMFFSFWRNRNLISALTKREVVGRYRGSFMGILWSFINPLLMLAVYTFVFSVVFKARWNTGSESKSEFALILFAGLIVFNVFSECVNQAPELIRSNVNYVKKVVFPVDILPWVSLCSALFHCLISFCVWLFFYVVMLGLPSLTILLFPIIVLPLALFVMGLSWALASLGVYIRDVSQFIRIATTVIMYLSPIFYPATALPENYRYLLFFNPLTPAIEQTRDILFSGDPPHPGFYSAYLACAMIVAWLGFAWFQKTRKGFADVL